MRNVWVGGVSYESTELHDFVMQLYYVGIIKIMIILSYNIYEDATRPFFFSRGRV